MVESSVVLMMYWLLTLGHNRVLGQIDYKKQLWKIPAKIWSAIERHQEISRDESTDYYNPRIEKLVVSAFIGYFKFSGYDPRASAVIQPNAFEGSFPQPPLRMMEPVLERLCRVSSADCVHYVFKHLQVQSLEKHEYKYGHKSYPYRNYSVISIRYRKENVTPLQLFHFQTTAMYFLCYWAIQLDDAISNAHWSCRYPGKKVSEKLRGRCFLNAVCPDPCCGNRLANDTIRNCQKRPDGICSIVLKKLTMCQRTEGFQEYKDMAIGQLARNGPAYACQCPESTTWHMDYLTCVDEDECLSGKHRCDPESQYCVNRVKGYFCACLWGYYPKSRYKCQAADIQRLVVALNSTSTTSTAPEIGIENLEEYVLLRMREIVGPIFSEISANQSRHLKTKFEDASKWNKTELVNGSLATFRFQNLCSCWAPFLAAILSLT